MKFDQQPGVLSRPLTQGSSSNPLSSKDIGQFFIKYMQNDNLGIIAHAHVAWADLNFSGVNSLECIQLAKMHSTAVDFAKTGIPVDFPSNLFPQSYPHFMEKQNSRKSGKALGQLYDRVKEYRKKERWNPQKHHFKTKTLRIDPQLIYPKSEDFMEEAMDLLYAYNGKLWEIMCQYNISSEAELFAGFALLSSFQSDYGGNYYNAQKLQDIQERLTIAMNNLRQEFFQIFLDNSDENEDPMIAVNEEEGEEGKARSRDHRLTKEEVRAMRFAARPTTQMLFAKASAWYQVAYDSDINISISSDGRPFLSFAWIPSNYLCAIKHIHSSTF